MSTLSDMLAAVRARRPDLERLGVTHAVLFGSIARGQDRPDSDVDVAITVDKQRVCTLFDHGDIQQQLEQWLGRPVDLARIDRLRPGIADEVAAEGVHAF